MINKYLFTHHTLQLTLPDHSMLSRDSHTVTAISLAPGLIEVTVFGGCPQFDPGLSLEKEPKLAATAILNFGKLAMTFVSNFKQCKLCVYPMYLK